MRPMSPMPPRRTARSVRRNPSAPRSSVGSRPGKKRPSISASADREGAWEQRLFLAEALLAAGIGSRRGGPRRPERRLLLRELADRRDLLVQERLEAPEPLEQGPDDSDVGHLAFRPVRLLLHPPADLLQLLGGFQEGLRDRVVRGADPALLSVAPQTAATVTESAHARRSEERRVGKECRSRWSPYH